MPASQECPLIGFDAVAAVCAKHIGSTVSRVERLAGSVGNQDFMVFTDRGDYVVKAAPGSQLAAEAWACDRVRELGVAAPEILVLETVSHSLASPFLMMRRLAGRAVTESSSALVEAGRHLRVAHTVDLLGYGALAVNESGAVGEHGSWAAFISDVTSGLEELVVGDVITDTLAAAASDTIARCDALHFHQPAVLLHGDLKLQHIFAESDRFVGVIDWGDACAGDPRFDLGRMAMAGETAFEAFASGYELTMTAELSRAFTAYRLVWNLDALHYEYRAGGDWFDSYRHGVDTAVASSA